MATFTGYLILDVVNGVGEDRPSWMTAIDFRNTGEGYSGIVEGLSGTRVYNQPSSFPDKIHSGEVVPGYADIFYNRILIEPIYIDFGSILSAQVQQITIFNAYLTNRTLEDISFINFDIGVFFEGDVTPKTYLPLEEQTHILTVTPNGPPNIQASIFYDWEATSDDITVEFMGSRVVLLPFTMRPGVKEKLVWLTNVMTSRNGTEQRVRHRNAPRQQFALEAYFNKEDRNLIENLLYGRVGQTAAIPLWTENRYADPITSGDTVINLSTLYGDFRVGSLAIVWESSKRFYTFQINALTDTSITTFQGIPLDFTNPIIMPVRNVRFLNSPKRYATGYNATISISIEVIDNIQLETEASDIQVNGEDFYDEEPLMANRQGVPDTYSTQIDLIDYSTGVVEQVTPWIYNRVSREFQLVLEGLEDIWNFRLWLHRRAGRLVPFYMPTFENNFFILSRGFLTDVLECQNDAHSSQAIDRSRLAFRKKDSTWVFRVILATEINEAGNEVITLDSPLGFNYEELDYASYLGLKRLASDTFEFTWLANNVAIVSVPIVEIAS